MAKTEEIAAATRRAALEQEMRSLAIQPTAPAPGLPTSSTWGSGVSPATPSTAPLAWAKPVAKPQVASPATTKKTLADIQREEELRKQKLAAATAAAQPVSGVSGGKRYADLASKSTAPAQQMGGAAWSTVGAGGKVRIPTGPSAAVPQAVRSTSNANVATTSTTRAPARPAVSVRSATMTGQSSINAANDEFTKWAKGELTRGLTSGINGKVRYDRL